MERMDEVNSRIVKAVLKRLYCKYPKRYIAEALGLKLGTVQKYINELKLNCNGKNVTRPKNNTLKEFVYEIVKREVEKIKRELNLDS